MNWKIAHIEIYSYVSSNFAAANFDEELVFFKFHI